MSFAKQELNWATKKTAYHLLELIKFIVASFSVFLNSYEIQVSSLLEHTENTILINIMPNVS